MSRRNVPTPIRLAIMFLALCVAFSYGVGVGVYQWPPFSTLNHVRDALLGWAGFSREYRGEEELLRVAFTDPLIRGEQVHPPITSLDGIYRANRSLKLGVERFFDAYDSLEVIDASPLALDQGSTKVLKLTYKLAGEEYHAYAYSIEYSQPARLAALIIPGSGFNQSSGIYRNDRSNYHVGIMDAFGRFS